MRFSLVDRIVQFESPKKICAVKGLSLAEEYLADHFPGNPVMPGVLMLEAMMQAGSWLLRSAQDFSFSMYALKEAGNVRYAKFLMPADQLHLEVELLGIAGDQASFSGLGKIASKNAVSARWTSRFFNLAQEDPRMARNDALIIGAAKEQFRILGGVDAWRQMGTNAS